MSYLQRLDWRQKYELMIPILMLGPGKSFGELAVQKEVNVKIAHKPKPRAASVICRTDCKFAVMQKSDYQSVLDNIDRRKVEKLKEFFANIPFLKMLPRSVLSTLHLSLAKKKYQRGQVVCKEGDDSKDLYIINKGEFEVSKVIDMSKMDQPPKEEKKNRQ